MPDQDALAEAKDLISFINAAETPYHAVREVAARLARAGFRLFDERETWEIQPGTKGYVIRGGSTIVAFVAGTKAPARAGFVLMGAHTDSPNLRVKPNSDLTNVGYRQLSIEIYGGVLLTTWLDRDLAIGGQVVLRGGRTELVRLPGIVGRIPNVAIHLNRDVNQQGLILNPQIHLLPTLALESSVGSVELLELLVRALSETSSSGARATDIAAFDMCLFDAQGGVFGGTSNEFIFSSRLDNLASCHAACEALIAAGDAGEATRVMALYDHEEVGSQSVIGARSHLLYSILERISGCYGGGTQELAQAFARSLLISADMAHAVHPNYVDKHDKQHRPLLGAGPVIKTNANQSYASDPPGMGFFSDACKRCDVTPQYFVSRNDMPCGSTIGPISAARLGMRAVDVGNPMLSMHSCREMAGSADVSVMRRVLTDALVNYLPMDPAV